MDESSKSIRLNRKLLGYAAAAAGMVCRLNSTSGSIVYQDFPDVTLSPSSEPFGLDLNGDTALDFILTHVSVGSTQRGGATEPLFNRGGVVSTPAGPPPGGGCASIGCGYAALILAAGSQIDGQLPFSWGQLYGTWFVLPPQSGFLGLLFMIEERAHFGWARIGFDEAGRRIYDAAYENEPGVGIAAGAVPEPASLGVLALGAVGLASWRQRRPT